VKQSHTRSSKCDVLYDGYEALLCRLFGFKTLVKGQRIFVKHREVKCDRKRTQKFN